MHGGDGLDFSRLDAVHGGQQLVVRLGGRFDARADVFHAEHAVHRGARVITAPPTPVLRWFVTER